MAAPPQPNALIRAQLSQYHLTDLLQADGQVKKDPVTGHGLINSKNASEIGTLLMGALQSDPYLGDAGTVWNVARGLAVDVGRYSEHELAGRLYLKIVLNSDKVRQVDPAWPTEVVGVPIRYEIR